MTERKRIEGLFQQLERQPTIPFPQLRQPLRAPKTHGVYIIRDKKGRVVHVGSVSDGPKLSVICRFEIADGFLPDAWLLFQR